MELSEEIKKAIQSNLSGLCADELKKFIEVSQENNKKVHRLEAELEELRTTNRQLDGFRQKVIAVEQKERANAAKENELFIKEEILKMREKHAVDRVEEIRRLTDVVFQSNRLSYNMNLSMPNPNYAGNEYNSTSNISGGITKNT